MIGVSILAAGQGDLCRQLADKDKGKRWLGVDAGRTRAGAIFIRDAALSLECAVHAQYPAGDHEIILLEIATFIAAAESDPLVFQGSRFRVLEPKIGRASCRERVCQYV